MFVNLKSNLINHELESKLHVSLKQKYYIDKKESKLQQSRNEKIGSFLFNIRYNGILHGSSYLNFEEDVLTHNLNGVDTGDINNCRNFARDLTGNIVSVLKERISQNISTPLEATNKKRPVGLVADKITPNKRTGLSLL